ncbi:MAG: rhomboid family intramembrane serine protease [Xanthomonadales bacterium]|nr:rhomboid family intramembrane serine protease [Xanthomonadales bacterium]
MQLHRPDPKFTSSRKSRKNFLLALQIALSLAGGLWFILIADQYLDLELGRFGLRPREIAGLWGILTAPLLHGGVEHLFSNTLPLVVSVTAILYLYPNSSVRVIPMLWLGSGILAWLIGRPSLHVGASGFIYGVLAYVFVSGMIRQDMRSIAVSLMVWFMYGSMIWGILPIRPRMSWELHLAGAVLGVAMALVYHRWDRVPVKRYEWEEDDSVPEWYLEAQRKAEEDDDEPPRTLH